MGFEIFLRIVWLIAQLSFEGLPGMGYEILLRIAWLRA